MYDPMTLNAMMKVLNASHNPMSAMQGFIANNPTLKELQPLIDKNDGDYKKAFYDLASQKGVNPDEILKFLR